MPLVFRKQELSKSMFRQSSSVIADSSLLSVCKDVASDWTSRLEEVVNRNVLYVSQREYGVIDPVSRGDIEFIASDSATTCHILVLIHPETKVVGLAHFDGANTRQGTRDLLMLMDKRIAVCSRSPVELTRTRYQVYMFGGFADGKGTSSQLSKDLLDALQDSVHRLEIEVLCVSELNSRCENGVCHPIYRGVGVKCDTLTIHRVECEDRGPLQPLKSCRNFVGPKEMQNCYDNSTGEMLVEPFNYQPMDQADLWLLQSDKILLKYLSTSPEQEPSHFVAGVRQSLQCMLDHPRPMESIFAGGKVYRFKLAAGHWTQVNS